MRSHAFVRHARSPMPLKLKGVLVRHQIKQSEWARSITQFDGSVLGESAATLLLNWGQWPKRTPRDSIVQQTQAFLRGHGVRPEEISEAFEIEPERGSYWNAQPKRQRQLRAVPSQAPAIDPVEVEMLSMEAKKRFALFQDPFQNDVQSSADVFLAPDQLYIREAMYATAKHGGFLAVVGESGSGKTTLRRDLIERTKNEQITYIQPRTFDKAQLTASLICDAIVADLSTQTPRLRLEGKARQVEQILIGSAQAGNAHALVIEEAHDLSVSTLKYLKRFWEMEYGFKKLLSIILIGQPELKARLDERTNYEAREVIRRCEIAQLEPLNGHLEEYLQVKSKRVGKQLGDVFDADAFDAIRARLSVRRRGPAGEEVMSQLYPLVVNRLVTRAMNEAAEIGALRVNREVIEAL